MPTVTYSRGYTGIVAPTTAILAGVFPPAGGPTSNGTILSQSPTNYTVRGTAASGLQDWTIVLRPVSGQGFSMGPPWAGVVGEIEVYNPSGQLVMTIADLGPDNHDLAWFNSGPNPYTSMVNLTGSAENDRFIAGGGDDRLYGYGGDDFLFGGTGGNRLYGGEGNDRLFGDIGNDFLIGDAGNDYLEDIGGSNTIDGGDGNDRIFVTAGEGTILGGAGTDILAFDFTAAAVGQIVNLSAVWSGGMGQLGGYSDVRGIESLAPESYINRGSAHADTVTIGAAYTGTFRFNAGGGNDVVTGGSGNDELRGEGGDDRLDGGAGVNTLWGGIGNDTYIVSNTTTTLVELAGEGTDTVIALIDWTLGANIENLIVHDSVAFGYFTGNELGNVFTGNAGGNTINGMAGNDILHGGGGDDDLIGGDGDDILYGSAGLDNLSGGEGQDFLFGGEHNDTLRGGAGADQLWGEQGDDDMWGDDGNDELRGGQGSDTLRGGAGDDFLDGGSEADTMMGGSGNDTYIVDNVGDVVTENANEGTDTVRVLATMNFTLGANIEIGQYEGAGAGTLTGNGLNNTLSDVGNVATLDGGAGDDTLNGGLLQIGGIGNDTLSYGRTMRGGVGDDVYHVDGFSNDHVVVELAGEGYDTVYVHGVTHTLAANVEALIAALYSGENHEAFFTGNGLDNLIIGYAANMADTINGLDGNDILDGGGDNGISGRDKLYGGNGDDLLRGSTFAEVLDGGSGNDTIDVSRDNMYAETTTINLAGGVMRVGASNITTGLVSIENVIGTQSADVIDGTAGANWLRGEGGNDTIFGGAGVDRLEGGDGNDTLVGNADIFAEQNDILDGGAGDDLIYGERADTILGGSGYDRLIAINAYDWSLNMTATSIEYAVMDYGNDIITAAGQSVGVSVFASGGNDQVTGSSHADLIFGGVGNDVLIGGDGNDALVGEAGADHLDGGAGDDRIYFDAQDTYVFGGAGYDAGYITVGTGAGAVVDMGARSLEFLQDLAGASDTILGSTATVGLSIYAGGGADNAEGSAFDDIIWGEAGDDILSGFNGDDVLAGGAGQDRLRGGAGVDRLYGGAADGVRDTFVFEHTGLANRDFVYEFELANDRIDLSAFTGNTFANVSITTAGGNSTVSLNGQVVAVIAGVTGLTATNFIFAGAGSEGPSDTPLVQLEPQPETPLVRPDDGPDLPLIRPTVEEKAAPAEDAVVCLIPENLLAVAPGLDFHVFTARDLSIARHAPEWDLIVA